MSLRLTVTTRQSDGPDAREVPVIEAVGTVDVYTSPCLKAKALDLLRDGKHAFAIDLGDVDYLDSTGLGVILGAYKRARERDGNVVLVVPNPKVRRVFEITGLNKIISVFERTSEAVQFLAQSMPQPVLATVGEVS